jgi:hypothetical protein
MEYLKNLQKKTDEEEYDDLKLTYSFTPQPTLNRKYSNLEREIDTLFKEVKGKTKIFGICGGTSCGKSKITHYFQSRIDRSVIICEKDFFDKNKDSATKKAFVDDKENLFVLSNSDDGWSSERKHKLINYNDPDCYDWDSLIVFLNIYL